MLKVCVIGAGVIGLTSALQLQRAGYAVTVIDQASGPGTGASAANGAQLSYSYVQPLADPALLPDIPKLLLQSDGPLRLVPQLSLQQWRWCMGFLAACRRSVSRETTRQLLQLAAESRVATDAFMARHAEVCDFSQSGKLVLYASVAQLQKAAQQVALQAGQGPEQRILGVADAVQIEPALVGYQQQFAGAVYTASECAADGYKLCLALAAELEAGGAELLFNTEVLALDAAQGRVNRASVRAADGSRQSLAADCFVLAAGAQTPGLLRGLDLRIPVYPLKGYSITLPVRDNAHAPRVSVTDLRRKTVFARLGQRLRVAGTIELNGLDRAIVPARIAQLLRATEEVFGPGWASSDCQPWAGWRPATPTGLPLTGKAERFNNLYLNVGQGALGLTLAFGSAGRLQRLMQADAKPVAISI